MYTEDDDRYTQKDWYVCEKCHYTNVINIKKNPKYKPKQQNMWVNDVTWSLFSSLAREFKMSNGAFLAFLLGILQREKMTYDNPTQA